MPTRRSSIATRSRTQVVVASSSKSAAARADGHNNNRVSNSSLSIVKEDEGVVSDQQHGKAVVGMTSSGGNILFPSIPSTATIPLPRSLQQHSVSSDNVPAANDAFDLSNPRDTSAGVPEVAEEQLSEPSQSTTTDLTNDATAMDISQWIDASHMDTDSVMNGDYNDMVDQELITQAGVEGAWQPSEGGQATLDPSSYGLLLPTLLPTSDWHLSVDTGQLFDAPLIPMWRQAADEALLTVGPSELEVATTSEAKSRDPSDEKDAHEELLVDGALTPPHALKVELVEDSIPQQFAPRRRGRPPKNAKPAETTQPTRHLTPCSPPASNSTNRDFDDGPAMSEQEEQSGASSSDLSLTTFKPSKPIDPDLAQEYERLKDPSLTSRDRRALRNKLSARSFRERRKEYIEFLEGEVRRLTGEVACRDEAIEAFLQGRNDVAERFECVRRVMERQPRISVHSVMHINSPGLTMDHLPQRQWQQPYGLANCQAVTGLRLSTKQSAPGPWSFAGVSPASMVKQLMSWIETETVKMEPPVVVAPPPHEQDIYEPLADSFKPEAKTNTMPSNSMAFDCLSALKQLTQLSKKLHLKGSKDSLIKLATQYAKICVVGAHDGVDEWEQSLLARVLVIVLAICSSNTTAV